jgi:hypothetical protein
MYDGNSEAKSVTEAKKTHDWDNWWKAIVTEFDNMEEKQVWEICEKKKIPEGRKSLRTDGYLI